MKKSNFLLSAMLSTLLLTANLSAQHLECKDGKCFIKMNKFTSGKNLPVTIQHFKMKKMVALTPQPNIEPKTRTPQPNIEPKTRTPQPNIEPKTSEMVATAPIIIQEQANDENKLEIIAFDHSTYVKQQDEKLEPINDEVETIVLDPSKYIMTQAEKELREKTTLPSSDYYCKNQKKAVYNQELKTYQCAI